MDRLKKILLLFVILFGSASAQKKYSLQECIDLALKNNESIKTGFYSIAFEKQLKKTSTEIPKTTVLYTQGQFNSIYKYDNNITISQTLPNPIVFVSHSKLAKAQIKSSEYKLEAAKADLIYQVKTTYYSLLYSYAVHQILLREDSVYESFAKAVSTKFAAGKASLLEKTTAETQVMETKNQVIESDEDINSFQIQLQTLMQVNTDVNTTGLDFENQPLEINADTLRIASHPLLKHLQQQIKINDRMRSLESAKILPDLTLAYFNQTIYGPANIFGSDYFLTRQNRLQGFQVGIALPVWFYPQRAKVKAAEISTKMAETNLEYNTNVLEGQLKQSMTMYVKYRNSIHYYKNTVLTNLQVMQEEAFKSYGTTDFNYNDYLVVISKALNIKRNYLNVIHQNNMYALKIEYLLAD
jgi:cobalt-zinc-cadmium resistance protein CzcA